MGTCSSTPRGMVIDPTSEDTLKRNRNSMEEKTAKTNCILPHSQSTVPYVIESSNTNRPESDKEKIAIYEAVYLRNWNKVTELMGSMKFWRSADYVDRCDRTCLHWACIKSAPLPIIQNLMIAYGDAILMQDNLGKTPLHLACEFASPASVYLMLEMRSEATSLRDKENGRTPLAETIMCHRPPSIIEYLLDANQEQILTPDKKGNTPTVMFFMKYLGLFISLTGKSKGTWTCCGENVEDLIEIARLLLQAENCEQNDLRKEPQPQDHLKEKRNSNILHDAIMSPTCPAVFIEFLLSFYPKLADEVNSDGNLPIHVAAALTPLSSKELLRKYVCHECGKPQSKDTVHYYRRDPKAHFRQLLCHNCIMEGHIRDYERNNTDEKIVATVKALLSIDPTFAQMANKGNLTPLEIAKKSGHSWDDDSWNRIIDEITPPSSCQGEITDLELTIESKHVMGSGSSKAIVDDATSEASPSTIAQDSTFVEKENTKTSTSTKSLDLESPTNNDSSELSLSSDTHESKNKAEDIDDITDKSSQASVEDSIVTTKSKLDSNDGLNVLTVKDNFTATAVEDESTTIQDSTIQDKSTTTLVKDESTTKPSKDESTTNLVKDESFTLPVEGEPINQTNSTHYFKNRELVINDEHDTNSCEEDSTTEDRGLVRRIGSFLNNSQSILSIVEIGCAALK